MENPGYYCQVEQNPAASLPSCFLASISFVEISSVLWMCVEYCNIEIKQGFPHYFLIL